MKVTGDRKVVVFVLTSNGNDVYAAMTRVAVMSLRWSNPAIRIIIICDAETNRVAVQSHNPLIGEVDEWVSIETPAGDNFYRSRYLKTCLRSLIDGPFLFLDSDILVRGSLDPIFELDADVAGARNHSRSNFPQQVSDRDLSLLVEMNWQVDQTVYINTGVIFFNDSEKAGDFGKEWHRRWLQSSQKCHDHRDQPAFNSALTYIRPKVSVLPDHFNAQFKFNPAAAIDAVIWHYYSSLVVAPITLFESLIGDLLKGKKLDKKYVADLIECTHPWKRIPVFGSRIISGMMKRGYFKNWESALLGDNFRLYLVRTTRDKLVWKINHFLGDV